METDSFRVEGLASPKLVEPYHGSGDRGRRDAERRKPEHAPETDAGEPEEIDPNLMAPEEQEVGQVIDVSI